MNVKKLTKILRMQENPKLDFKRQLELKTESSKKEFVKDICAIANSRGGRGYLVVGVEDKTKRIVGVNKKDLNEEKIQQIVSSRCEPPIPISLKFVKYKNKDLAVISIYYSSQKPFQFKENGSFYIRRGSTTDTMRKEELISAFSENMSLNVEICPIINSSLSSFNKELVYRYFLSHGIEINEENKLFLMENTGIIIKDKETERYYGSLGGLAVFSCENYLYIPNNMVRIVNRVNKAFDSIILVQGDLLSIIDNTERILKHLLPESYPVEAVYEGIKNAVLYRDYTIFNKEIEVILDFNSIRVISPGILMKNSNGSRISSHNYIKRNMWIYEKLMTLDKNKRFLQSGRGFSKMKKAFKGYGKVIFINSIESNSFKVIYPGIKINYLNP